MPLHLCVETNDLHPQLIKNFLSIPDKGYSLFDNLMGTGFGEQR